MWVFDEIGDIFAWLSHYSYLAYVHCDSIPLLGGTLEDFFYKAYDFFHSMAGRFYDLGDWADEVLAKLDDIISWDTITGWLSDLWNRAVDYIAELWTWITEHVAELWTYITTHFAELWSYITEHLAQLWNQVVDYISPLWTWITQEVADIWRWLSDLPSRVGDIIWQWLTDNLWQWIKDRAAQAVDVAGSILEAVW